MEGASLIIYSSRLLPHKSLDAVEMPDIARDQRQVVVQRGRGDQQVHVVNLLAGQLQSSSLGRKVAHHRAIQGQDDREAEKLPKHLLCRLRIVTARDPIKNFPVRDDADTNTTADESAYLLDWLGRPFR